MWPVCVRTMVPKRSYVRFMMSADGSAQKTAYSEVFLPSKKFSSVRGERQAGRAYELRSASRRSTVREPVRTSPRRHPLSLPHLSPPHSSSTSPPPRGPTGSPGRRLRPPPPTQQPAAPPRLNNAGSGLPAAGGWWREGGHANVARCRRAGAEPVAYKDCAR